MSPHCPILMSVIRIYPWLLIESVYFLFCSIIERLDVVSVALFSFFLCLCFDRDEKNERVSVCVRERERKMFLCTRNELIKMLYLFPKDGYDQDKKEKKMVGREI